MKKYITIIILVFAMHYCQESNNTNPESSPGTPSGGSSTKTLEKFSPDSQDKGQSLNLTKEFLEKNKWDSDSDDGFGQKISFQQGKVEYERPGYEEPSQFYLGTYTIQNNQLEISYQTMKYMDEVETDSSKMTCSYSIAKESLNYNEKLECALDFDPDIPISFYNQSSKLKEGDSRTIDSIEVTIFRKTLSSTVDSLMVRSSPSAKAEPIQWIVDDGNYGPPRTSLKKGEKVKIIARTKEKMSVNKMKNYWYYVEIPSVDGEKPIFFNQNGWVFGGFLK